MVFGKIDFLLLIYKKLVLLNSNIQIESFELLETPVKLIYQSKTRKCKCNGLKNIR
jgi:hypothetical protein